MASPLPEEGWFEGSGWGGESGEGCFRYWKRVGRVKALSHHNSGFKDEIIQPLNFPVPDKPLHGFCGRKAPFFRFKGRRRVSALELVTVG